MDEPHTRQRETARQRALRIPLAYHRAREAVWFWRMGLSLTCFLASAVYLGWVLTGGKSTAMQVSPGTLARDHARWDSDCKACHTPFVTQRADADGIRALSLSLAGNSADASHRQSDAKCSECHKSAGTHHANQVVTEVEACASCHRDHQGRDFHMARMDDAHCTACHASIAGHRSQTGSAPVVNVTSFERVSAEAPGHPAFRSLQLTEDPGNIRFSHRLHMTLGQLYPGQETPKGKHIVQLACDACHVPESAGNGAYMKPIKYEQHCRGCHPLSLPENPGAAVSHGLASEPLEKMVRGLVSKLGNPPEPSQPPRTIPGKASRIDAAIREPSAELVFARRMAELRENKCSQCHSWQPEQPTEVQPAKIPAIWLQHARFNHEKHKSAAKCVDCHTAAADRLPAAGVPGRLADDNAVMIPNIDNCIRCHAPHNESASVAGVANARFDCAECHNYHQTKPEQKPLRQKAVSENSLLLDHDHLRITLVADRPSQRPAPEKRHPFVGTQSCSTTGCHGANGERGSPSAFTRFRASDPHAGAFLLLYSETSRKIVHRLRGAAQPEPSDAEYFSFLDKNCLGCHATPTAVPARKNEAASYYSGVSCESCHGAAADWEFNHFRKGAKPQGMTNLTSPAIAAPTCAECHIGPKQMEGKSYDVNHDIIAAGHPRLTFQFEAQLANLPPHWSPAKNIKSHFEAWKAGELATATQQDRLNSARDKLEFASQRCFDCHHYISTAVPPTRRASGGALASARRDLLSQPATTTADKKLLMRKLLDSTSNSSSSRGTRWEEHVDLSLGLAAFSADFPRDTELVTNVENLTIDLAHSFRLVKRDRKSWEEQFFAGGHYDSPTSFDPDDPLLKQVLARIRASLAAP